MSALQWLIVKISVGVLAVALGVMAWQSHEAAVYKRGYDAAVTERAAFDAAKLAKDAAAALTVERQAQEAQRIAQIARQEKERNYEIAIAGLRADVANGRRRLQLVTHNPGLPASTAPKDAPIAPGPGEEGGAAIVPEVGSAILDIGTGITRLVRRHNALIDEYDRLRTACNAVPDG